MWLVSCHGSVVMEVSAESFVVTPTLGVFPGVVVVTGSQAVRVTVNYGGCSGAEECPIALLHNFHVTRAVFAI